MQEINGKVLTVDGDADDREMVAILIELEEAGKADGFD